MSLVMPEAPPDSEESRWSVAPSNDPMPLDERFRTVRAATERLTAPLSPEDCQVQSMTDASPTKWHLAHTTWFFEQFVLRPHARGYESFDDRFAFLFNSYYNFAGDRIARPSRGLMTRPSLDEVLGFRAHVTAAIRDLLDRADEKTRATIDPLIEIGLNHEQQHQELILTDVKHLLSQNPLEPAYIQRAADASRDVPEMRFVEFEGGAVEIGHAGEGFCYDNECARHEALLRPFGLADRTVTNGEYLAFMEDGGYQRHEFWLDMAWATVNEEKWTAPLYWRRRDDAWYAFTLGGALPLHPAEPVTHVSYFEADAFARWAGKRLPSEFEWEHAAAHARIEGNFAETERFHPAPVPPSPEPSLRGLFGDVWEWTQSHYSPYPGFQTPEGALGEYNGKFMCNQFVLRGGSCATPVSHIRRTYRNFWGPATRFQFSGIRLAEDA